MWKMPLHNPEGSAVLCFFYVSLEQQYAMNNICTLYKHFFSCKFSFPIFEYGVVMHQYPLPL